MVQSAHLEAGQKPGRVVSALKEELRLMQSWLGLDSLEIANKGDLSARLRKGR